MNGQDYQELPLDANVREPQTKTPPYKEMIKTLEKDPDKFLENNLGISAIASSIRRVGKFANNEITRGAELEIFFKPGTGILNGGHTQLALLNARKLSPNVSKAKVRITIRVKDYDAKRITEIATAQNSCISVKPYSLAEKKGLFEDIKKLLDPEFEKHIIWYEGKDIGTLKGLKAEDLVAILNVFNIKLYSSNYNGNCSEQPIISANSKAAAFNKWQKDSEETIHTYKIIYPLVNDIIRLYEYIQMHTTDKESRSGLEKLGIISKSHGKEHELTFSGLISEYDIPKQMMYPILAAFRANVYYDEANNKIGWFEDNELVFKKVIEGFGKKLRTSYQKGGYDINRIGKDPALWENLYNYLRDSVDKSNGAYVTYDIKK